jgi:hypothetical protein
MSEQTFEALTIIATRKAKFYQRSRNELLKQIPPTVNKDTVKVALRKAISEVDNSLFIGKMEKETKVLNASTPIDQLGLDSDRIVAEVVRKLSSAQARDY